ncbi:hypothetical protein [Bacillus sp. S14(2024)]|uniref:hypothetical protein n=1 Tax=Bacillus sp. S14(2024) TaxID=3162884 RepID=UPI003D1EB36E
MKNRISNYTGGISSVGIFSLSIIFLYLNPYTAEPPNQQTIFSVFIILLLPSCLALVALIMMRRLILMSIFFTWLLPATIYLGIAAIPSIWNLYIILLIIYLISIFLVKADK